MNQFKFAVFLSGIFLFLGGCKDEAKQKVNGVIHFQIIDKSQKIINDTTTVHIKDVVFSPVGIIKKALFKIEGYREIELTPAFYIGFDKYCIKSTIIWSNYEKTIFISFDFTVLSKLFR